MAITNEQLTEATLSGNGLFDILMRATKAHLQEEYSKQRISGPEYAKVYLESLTAVLGAATEFLLQRDLKELERQILEVRLEMAALEKDKVEAEIRLVEAQVALAEAEAENVLKMGTKLEAETLMIGQQTTNLAVEALNIPKIGSKLDAEVLLVGQQKANLAAEAENIPKIGDKLDAEALLTTQQRTNLEAEALNIPKQGAVLDGQKCKLDAEFDVLQEQRLKTASETSLLNQKRLTEQAQTSSTGIDPNSVVGKQIALYAAQTEGFQRDAEQKAAKIMIDSWNTRRVSDEGTVADSTNKLADAYIGQAVTRLLAGINA